MTLARKVTVNASALAAGRAVATVLGIVSVGLSTRYLGVDAFGALVTALAFSSLLSIITDAGIWTIATREISKRPEQTGRIFATTLTIGFGFSALAAAIGLGVAFLAYGGEGDTLTREAILLLLLSAPLSAPVGAVGAYFISQQRAWVGSVALITSSVVQVAGVALVTALDLGFTGLALSYLAGPVAQVTLMLPLAAGRVSLRPSWDGALGRQLLGWALPLSGATIVGSLYWRIDLILLSFLSSDRQVGFYGLAYRVVDALVVLPQFVLITLVPEFARLSERRERLQEVAVKASTVMQVGALAMLAIFAGFAREIVEVVGGPQFDGVEPILQVLVLGVTLNYSSAVLAQVLVAVNREVRLLFVSLALLPFNVVLNLALIPLWGALGAATAFALSEALHLALLALIYRGHSTFPLPQRLLRVVAAAALVGAVACAKLLPFAEGAAPIFILMVGVPIAVATYVAALYGLNAMPSEIHANLVAPAWGRLRRYVRTTRRPM